MLLCVRNGTHDSPGCQSHSMLHPRASHPVWVSLGRYQYYGTSINGKFCRAKDVSFVSINALGIAGKKWFTPATGHAACKLSPTERKRV